jgi:hypothetical protein
LIIWARGTSDHLEGFEPPVDSDWLLPAVPEAGAVFDLVEGQIERSKLVSDNLQKR